MKRFKEIVFGVFFVLVLILNIYNIFVFKTLSLNDLTNSLIYRSKIIAVDLYGTERQKEERLKILEESYKKLKLEHDSLQINHNKLCHLFGTLRNDINRLEKKL